MKSSSTFAALLLLTAAALVFGGCRPDDERPPSEPQSDTAAFDLTFHQPEFPEGRRLDTMLSVDLDASRRPVYIVTSMLHDSTRYLPPTARADLIQVYRFDTVARSYRIVAADSLQWITALNLRDVTGDRLPDLVVSTYSGGNDIVASSGMYIYSGDGGSVRPVLTLDSGNPEFKRFGRKGGDAVVIYSELWPDFFAHAEAVPYIDDVLEFRDGTFASARNDHHDFFRDQANDYLTAYQSARDSLQTAAPADSLDRDAAYGLFAPAALVMRSFALADATSALRSFWGSEQNYLRTVLPESQYAELETIYQSTIPQ